MVSQKGVWLRLTAPPLTFLLKHIFFIQLIVIYFNLGFLLFSYENLTQRDGVRIPAPRALDKYFKCSQLKKIASVTKRHCYKPHQIFAILKNNEVRRL